MLDAAGKCNLWRNIDYMMLSTKMMLGLTPVLTPWVTRKFFNYPYAFYISALLIVSAVLLLLLRRRYSLATIIVICVGIYLGMVFIVALKQGGENRYTDTVEPMFVLGVAIAASVLCQELLQRLASLSPRISDVWRVNRSPK
jgi:ABC-type Fe3+-siderophore transport system permease subunit